MKNLIRALEIFLKYGNPEYPTIDIPSYILISKMEAKHIAEAFLRFHGLT